MNQYVNNLANNNEYVTFEIVTVQALSSTKIRIQGLFKSGMISQIVSTNIDGFKFDGSNKIQQICVQITDYANNTTESIVDQTKTEANSIQYETNGFTQTINRIKTALSNKSQNVNVFYGLGVNSDD